MRQRIACTLIGTALALICALVALLLSDALAPGRVPPMLAFWAACVAGGLLMLGLALLDRRGPVSVPRHGFEGNGVPFAGRQIG
jgi:hypothetical protein